MSIILSLLDQDFYKLSMQQIVLHQFSSFNVKYRFKCRNKGVIFTDTMFNRIRKEAEHFSTLRTTPEELSYLKTIRFLKPSYIEFLKLYQPSLEHVEIGLKDSGELDITIEGPWFSTIYWEVPLLAIVNEVYMEEIYKLSEKQIEGYLDTTERKLQIAKENRFKFSDFGTRRRFSRDIQEAMIKLLRYNKDIEAREFFTGTSNVYFAMKYKTGIIGTMAHEFICAGQGCDDVTLANSQKYMLQKWVDEYRGDLGIALSDTLGIDKFLKDFDPYFAKLYDGVRHDSGDPFEWGEKMIKHYEKFKIDPKTKTLVFSDGLTFEKAAGLQKVFGPRAKVAFGIGTNLTNDIEGCEALQMVIKMVECNGRPVAKLSDSPGKLMCENQEFINYLKSII